MAHLVINIDGTLVDCDHGVWCEHCALPSAYTLHIVLTPVSNPTHVMGRLKVTRCDDCGRRIRTPEPAPPQ